MPLAIGNGDGRLKSDEFTGAAGERPRPLKRAGGNKVQTGDGVAIQVDRVTKSWPKEAIGTGYWVEVDGAYGERLIRHALDKNNNVPDAPRISKI
jgi:hypothetical protein